MSVSDNVLIMVQILSYDNTVTLKVDKLSKKTAIARKGKILRAHFPLSQFQLQLVSWAGESADSLCSRNVMLNYRKTFNSSKKQ